MSSEEEKIDKYFKTAQCFISKFNLSEFIIILKWSVKLKHF